MHKSIASDARADFLEVVVLVAVLPALAAVVKTELLQHNANQLLAMLIVARLMVGLVAVGLLVLDYERFPLLASEVQFLAQSPPDK